MILELGYSKDELNRIHAVSIGKYLIINEEIVNMLYHVLDKGTAEKLQAEAIQALDAIFGYNLATDELKQEIVDGISLDSEVATKSRFANSAMVYAGQGWIFNEENKVWTGEKWATLLELLGPGYTHAELLSGGNRLAINDEGLAVAKIQKSGEDMKIGLLLPVEIQIKHEIQPKWFNMTTSRRNSRSHCKSNENDIHSLGIYANLKHHRCGIIPAQCNALGNESPPRILLTAPSWGRGQGQGYRHPLSDQNLYHHL